MSMPPQSLFDEAAPSAQQQRDLERFVCGSPTKAGTKMTDRIDVSASERFVLLRDGSVWDLGDPAERCCLVDLVRKLASDTTCVYDHSGNCQEHNWFSEGRCPHAVAQELGFA